MVNEGDEPAGDVGDVIGDLMSGIPTPVRRNTAIAFDKLCTAALEWPVAALEGAAAERRALAAARVKLIASTTDQIAGQLNVHPEYARAAVRQFGAKIVREAINLDAVSEITAGELRNSVGARRTKLKGRMSRRSVKTGSTSSSARRQR